MTPDEIKQQAEDHEEQHREKCRILHALGLLDPKMRPFDVFMLCPLVSLETVQAMTPTERATCRANTIAAGKYTLSVIARR